MSIGVWVCGHMDGNGGVAGMGVLRGASRFRNYSQVNLEA